MSLREQANDSLETLAEYPTRVILRERNDNVEVEFELLKFPGIALTVRPMNLYLDSESVFPSTFDEGGIILEPGEVRELENVRIESVTTVPGGPGPDEMDLWLETVE